MTSNNLMEFLTKKQAEDECGPANAITPFQIRNMLRLANVGKNDIFYDLGSGHGRIVRMAITEGHAKEAIGIEDDADRFCSSRTIAKRELSKKQLKRAEFLCGDMEEFDLSDANIVYEGHEQFSKEIEFYKRKFKNKRVKIVKKDLPLVSYMPLPVNRKSSTCWFFLMKYPLQKYKTRNKHEWAKHLLDRENVTIRDVYTYYDKQLRNRGIIRSERIKILRRLKKLVSERF